MIFWVDAQLPPNLAPWLTQAFGVEAYSLRYIGLHTAEDGDIFDRARRAGDVVLISKESRGQTPFTLRAQLSTVTAADGFCRRDGQAA